MKHTHTITTNPAHLNHSNLWMCLQFWSSVNSVNLNQSNLWMHLQFWSSVLWKNIHRPSERLAFMVFIEHSQSRRFTLGNDWTCKLGRSGIDNTMPECLALWVGCLLGRVHSKSQKLLWVRREAFTVLKQTGPVALAGEVMWLLV